jgi:SAM-dependent methyltransferase
VKGYRTVRTIYHSLMPEPLRDRIYQLSPAPVKLLKRRVVAVFEKDANHDDIYNDAYYGKFVEPTMQISAIAIAESVAGAFAPRLVVDLGCGTGVLLSEFRRLGIQGVGLELADAAIARCVKRGLDVRKYDIERDPAPELRADVVVSTEVAEHLPESCADRFVDALIGMARTVVLTAATPSLVGTDHVNEQPNSYWIEKFEARGRRFDKPLSMTWRTRWTKASVADCFASSVMVFRYDDSLRQA